MAELSSRAHSNLEGIMSKIPKAILDGSKSTSCVDSKSRIIDLSMAENWLVRPEILELCKAAIDTKFQASHLSWPTGFWGDPEVLEALAHFFNAFFKPYLPVQPTHITLAPGAAACLDALLYNICEEGDGVLVPGPYWNGYDIFFRIRASVRPVEVTVPDLGESLSSSLIPALESAFEKSPCPIKALVLANPHNPLGRCYSRDVLEMCLRFCNARRLHLISDEVFALSTFHSPDLPLPVFTSILSVDSAALGCDPSRVHAVWSTSKDFGSSGIKIGCSVTQQNDSLRNALALAAHMNVSTLSAVFASELLRPQTMPRLLELNSTRLADAYALLTSFLQKMSIDYFPCNAGPFLLAHLAKDAETWDDETIMAERFRQVGVLVGPGRRYHLGQPGWARVCFAMPPEVMEEAMKKMEHVFSERSGETELNQQ